jgi:fatty acid desaturase
MKNPILKATLYTLLILVAFIAFVYTIVTYPLLIIWTIFCIVSLAAVVLIWFVLYHHFKLLASPNLEHWNEADDEQRTIYAKEQVKEFLTENLDLIVDDLMKDSKITY